MMRIDKAGEYRTNNGQRVMINLIFSGRAFGCIMDAGGFVESAFWYCGDASHPTQSDLRIVSEWVATRQQDDDKVAQNLLYSVQRLLAAIDGVQDWGGTEVGDAINEVESQLFHWRTQSQR